MAPRLLPDGISRQMRNIYNNMKDYSGYCFDKGVCHSVCCTADTSMSYVEFAYMIDFLGANLAEREIKEILNSEVRRPKESYHDLSSLLGLGGDSSYCKILDSDTGCLAYPARPFRCREYQRDDGMGMCRPQTSWERDMKSQRRIWRLDDSVTPIPEPKRAIKEMGLIELTGVRENNLGFWIKEILGY